MSINTGPTATALHHLLAALYDLTGLDPIWLLLAVVLAGIAACGATLAVCERYLVEDRDTQ